MSKSAGRSKNAKKTRKNNQDLEPSNLFEDDLAELEEIDDLDESDLDVSDESDLDDLDEIDDLDELDEGKKKKRGTSMSKEINKMIKDGNLAVPAIGFGLLAIIGFAIYKGGKF
jgi:hypothetical protein